MAHHRRKPYLAAQLRKLGLGASMVGFLAFAPTLLQAQMQGDLDGLFTKLKSAEVGEADKIAREIRRSWSRSGSASADLLLKRGREALRAKKTGVAIEHLTALVDHAPEFAEGWHMRASAYYQSELYGPALEDLAHTLALNPHHFEAIQGLGAIFEQLGDPERAFAAYTQVLTIHPHHSGVLEAMERLETKVLGPQL